MPDIKRETVPNFGNGWTEVDATAVRAVANDLPDMCFKGVLLYAPGATDDTPNSEVVYVGYGPDILATCGIGGGMPIVPGQSLSLPIESMQHLYAIAGAAGQLLAWMLV